MTRHLKLSITLFVLSAIAGLTVASDPVLAAKGTANANGKAGPTISTSDGPVRGFVKNGVNNFLGVPYAAPPACATISRRVEGAATRGKGWT